LSTRDFWTDEAGRIATAKEPLPLLWADMFGHEQTPPLYYLLLRVVITFAGDSVTSYRLLSFGAGVAIVWLAWSFGRELYGPRGGLLTALLVATSPYFIALAQDANTYSLLSFVSLLAIWQFWRAVHSPRRRTWVACACATTVALYLHHYFWLVVLCEAAFLAVCWIAIRKVSERWYVGGTVVVALYAPYLPILVRQFQAAQGKGYVGRSLPEYIQTLGTNLFNLGTGYRLNEFDTVILQAAAWRPEPRVLELLLAAAVPLTLAGIGMLSTVCRERECGLFIVLLFGGTLLIGSYTLFLSRHLAVVAGLYFLAITAGLLSLPERVRFTALGLMLLINATSLYHFYSTPFSRSRPQDWRGIAQTVADGMQPGDVVVVNAWIGGAFAFTYHMWSIDPKIFADIPLASPRGLPGPVPPSWGKMEPKPKERKIAYTWLVTAEHRLVETTDPMYLSGHEEARRIQRMTCAQCRVWIVYDTWDQQGQPLELRELTVVMTPIAVEQRSRYLRLSTLTPRARQSAP
jgi:4-amino-4-deoxy-L-arabinose transferase-like glycosyltransferase